MNPMRIQMRIQMNHSRNWLLFTLTSMIFAGSTSAFAVDFSNVTVSCHTPAERSILQCGIRWGDDEQGLVFPMTEQVLDYLHGLDWKDHFTYQCDAKLGALNTAGRQVFDIRNCRPFLMGGHG